MENGWNYPKSSGGEGENVVRGGKEGGLNEYSYSATSATSTGGWTKVDANAGEVYPTGMDGDHFAKAMHTGNAGAPQPGAQT